MKSWSVPGIEGLECFRAEAMAHRYDRHSHEGYAIGVIERGIGVNVCRGATHHFPPGHIVVMNPEEAHTGHSRRGHPLTYRMFYVHPELFRSVLDTRENSYFPAINLHDGPWSRRLYELHRLLEFDADLLQRQSALIVTLSGFARAHAGARVQPAGDEPLAVARVREYLDANHHRAIGLDELCTLTGLSRSYLIRAFRRRVGLPPHAYLLLRRIRAAKRLLAAGGDIADVALKLGFVDQAHLSRRFKRVTGLTPWQYARGHFRTR